MSERVISEIHINLLKIYNLNINFDNSQDKKYYGESQKNQLQETLGQIVKRSSLGKIHVIWSCNNQLNKNNVNQANKLIIIIMTTITMITVEISKSLKSLKCLSPLNRYFQNQLYAQ